MGLVENPNVRLSHDTFRLSRIMRKPAFCISDVLCLCFSYMNSTIPLLPKSKSSSLNESNKLLWLYSPIWLYDLVGSCEDRFSHDAVHLSLVMRKPASCICENKDADQLRGNREADQRLCLRYIDSTIPLLSKYEISSL